MGKKACKIFVAFMLLIMLIPMIVINEKQVKGVQTGSFYVVSQFQEPENPSLPSFLDILQLTIEYNGFSQLRLNMTLRGPPPDPQLFSNITSDDNLSYAWYIDADRNSSTGQQHGDVGSEYNVMIQVSGGSPAGQWGARVDAMPGLQGGGSVQYVINGNLISLLVGLSQIGGSEWFNYCVDSWGRLNGASIGEHDLTTMQTVDLFAINTPETWNVGERNLC